MPHLIVCAGLPGTGKSALAETVARELGIPVFAKDWLEGALLKSSLHEENTTDRRLGFAAYELLTILAERQLQLGQSAILDSVASTRTIREQWRALAARYGALWRVIECVCSDENLQRARLATRQRNIPGWHELEWTEVERVRAYYAAWDEERLIVDMGKPLTANVAAVLRYLSS